MFGRAKGGRRQKEALLMRSRCSFHIFLTLSLSPFLHFLLSLPILYIYLSHLVYPFSLTTNLAEIIVHPRAGELDRPLHKPLDKGNISPLHLFFSFSFGSVRPPRRGIGWIKRSSTSLLRIRRRCFHPCWLVYRLAWSRLVPRRRYSLSCRPSSASGSISSLLRRPHPLPSPGCACCAGGPRKLTAC
jgi:hypothetical protein